jgi:hypothetical protein
MARRKPRRRRKPTQLRRVSLHAIRDRIAAADKVLANGIKSANAKNRTKMLTLRQTLKQIRTALSNECCDNVWVCKFDQES